MTPSPEEIVHRPPGHGSSGILVIFRIGQAISFIIRPGRVLQTSRTPEASELYKLVLGTVTLSIDETGTATGMLYLHNENAEEIITYCQTYLPQLDFDMTKLLEEIIKEITIYFKTTPKFVPGYFEEWITTPALPERYHFQIFKCEEWFEQTYKP